MKKELPTLYKKTSTGAIQFWTIGFAHHGTFGRIETTYGQFGTDNPQYTEDVIENGKNSGRSNETTPFEQAQAEAQARWTKQLKKGYVESLKAAQAGEVDEIIEGGIVPMLAQSYKKHAHKIIYPAYLQRKYDGHRMICVVKDGVASLWSRTRKQIFSLPHIIAEVEKAYPQGNFVLDGEGYNDKFSNNFEHITHLIRQENPAENHTDVEYHVYDMPNVGTFAQRFEMLGNLVKLGDFRYIKLAPTERVDREEEALDKFVEYLNEGYEGAMIRNARGLYVNKRSYDLQKIKEMDDSEYPIADVKEGRGKLAGHAIFVCKLDTTGVTFDVKMKGETSKLKEFWENHSLWKNKLLTVQHQGFTSYGMPRFPVGLRLREDV
jgi:DNA ligase-1